MRRPARRGFSLLFGCATCGALCVLLVLVGGLLFGVPERLAALGPPAPTLDVVQRVLLGGYLLLVEDTLDQAAGDPARSLELVVEEGETAGQVVERLSQAGVAADAFLLRTYLRYRGLDTGVEAGRYLVHGGMTTRELAQVLQSARPTEFLLTVVEGWRKEQIAGALEQMALRIKGEAFLAESNLRPLGYSFSNELPEPPSLEGFLFPDTYRVDEESSVGDLVRAMLDNFESRVDQSLRDGFAAQGLDLFEAVTLASIVEREAVIPDERPVIASVFLNRLVQGMHLDADPTVQYALGLQPDGGWWKAPLFLDDLNLASPYNTYLQGGLPPGPIANPGLSALEAVAFPSQTTYLYFRARCDGSGRHEFAETFEQHLGNACP